MKTLQILNDRIVFSGIPKHSPSYSSIPGARWNKKLQAWTYPPSPIALARLRKTMQTLNDHIPAQNITAEVHDLWLQWTRYKDDVKWKSKDALEVCEKLAAKGEGFHTTTPLWAHQMCAVNFIEHKRFAYLAMDMGTGKTLTMIEEMIAKGTTKNLIICPKSVCAVWADELKKHSPKGTFQPLVLDRGTTEAKCKTLATVLAIHAKKHAAKQLVVIINYESFWRDGIFPLFKKTIWDMLIFDEAHRIKAPGSQVSKHAAQLKSDWKRGLSGTPLPNTPLDGYGQWRAIDPALLGTNFAAHRARFAVVETFKGFPEITEWKNLEELGKLFDLQTFKVDRSILKLPDATESYRAVIMPKKAMDIYQEMLEEFVTWSQSGVEVTAQNALSRLMKLRQITCGFIIDDDGNTSDVHDAREEALKDLLLDLPEDDKVVIFCEFTHNFGAVQRVCEKLKRSYGEVSSRRNDTVGGKFRDDINILAVQPKAGGLGLNLTAAHTDIFYSTGFSLADHEQAKARIHRGGQGKQVNHFHFTVQGTVDEQIYQALKGKRKVIDFVLDEIL